MRRLSSICKTTHLLRCVTMLSTSMTATLKRMFQLVLYKKTLQQGEDGITSYCESKPKCYWTVFTSLLAWVCSIKTDFCQLQTPFWKTRTKELDRNMPASGGQKASGRGNAALAWLLSTYSTNSSPVRLYVNSSAGQGVGRIIWVTLHRLAGRKWNADYPRVISAFASAC